MLCDRILPAELAGVWQQFAEVLGDCRETWYPWWDIRDIKAHLLTGDSQLWTVIDEKGIYLWFMTEIIIYPRQTELRIWWASGVQFTACVPIVIPAMRSYARHVGARTITMVGRTGFERVLKPFGVKVQNVTYAMEALDG